MDTSKEYVKMCEKAQEIQELWEELTGDFCYLKDTKYKIINIVNNPPCKITSHLWLPRQDQLQEMVKDKDITGDNIHFYLSRFVDFTCDKYYWQFFKTMEQLWLAFVMKEKYNKVWNGKDWRNND